MRLPDEAPRQPADGRVPALDGLRGLAVAAVLAFHGGVGFLPGGFLGVDAFFVLSGYLITTLLIRERASTGRIALGAFWARRARRLLPALAVVVVAVCVVGRVLVPPAEAALLRADALGALAYVANWRMIWRGTGRCLRGWTQSGQDCPEPPCSGRGAPPRSSRPSSPSSLSNARSVVARGYSRSGLPPSSPARLRCSSWPPRVSPCCFPPLRRPARRRRPSDSTIHQLRPRRSCRPPLVRRRRPQWVTGIGRWGLPCPRWSWVTR
jgi:hypothetical protein